TPVPPAGVDLKTPRPPAPTVPTTMPATVAAAPPATTAPSASMARVAFDFEHFVESGTLTINVDGKRVSSHPLTGRKEKKLGIPSGHDGSVTDMFEVPGGRHTIEVVV